MFTQLGIMDCLPKLERGTRKGERAKKAKD
jgi:hypothetical protein